MIRCASDLKTLISILPSSETVRTAVLRVPASLLDEQKLHQMIGFLRLHGWQIALNLKKEVLGGGKGLKKKLAYLFDIGVSRIHITLDEKSIKNIGVKRIGRFCQLATYGGFDISVSYTATSRTNFPVYLSQLLDDANYSRFQHYISIENNGRSRPYDSDISAAYQSKWFTGSARTLILNDEMEMKLTCGSSGEFFITRISDPDWKKIFQDKLSKSGKK